MCAQEKDERVVRNIATREKCFGMVRLSIFFGNFYIIFTSRNIPIHCTVPRLIVQKYLLFSVLLM